MPATLPYNFQDGPGNTASGVQVMQQLAAMNAGIFMPVGTTLPPAPVDGQDYFYVADAGNNIVWHMKWRAAASRWVYVGGPPLYANVDANEAGTATAAYQDLATIGPTVTVPVAGDYMVDMRSNGGGGTVTNWVVGLSVNGAAVVANEDMVATVPTTGGQIQFASRLLRRVGVPAAATLRMRYNPGSAVVVSWSRRSLAVHPVSFS